MTATATATTNLETVQAIYQAFGQGDVPAILARLAPDVAWEQWASNSGQAAGVPWFAARTGREAVGGFFQVIGTDFDIHEFSLLDFMAGDRQVAVEFVMDATIRSTGKHFRDEEMHLWTFNESGQVTRLRHYADTAKHIAAATK